MQNYGIGQKKKLRQIFRFNIFNQNSQFIFCKTRKFFIEIAGFHVYNDIQKNNHY